MKNLFHMYTSFRPGRALALAGALLALPWAADAANPVLRFQALGSLSGNVDVTAFVDQVEIVRVSDGVVMAGAVANAGFETNGLSAGQASYSTGGATWTFDSRSGISRSSSGGFAPTPPVGDAVALIQTATGTSGQINQTLVLADGTYQVRFLTAQRTNCCGGTYDQRLSVLINGVSVGMVQPPSSVAFTSFTSSTFVVSTPTNNALAFDGVNDQVTGTNAQLPQGNAARTLEAWVNPSNTGVGIVTYGTNTGNQRSGLSLVSNKLYYAGAGNDLTGATAIALGTWHHVAATYDGTTMKLYLDGVLDASQAMSAFNTTGTGFLLGYTGNAAEYLNGRLDEVRIYNAALTQAQVQADMFSTVSALPANLKAYYAFDQGTANSTNAGITSLADQSGNGLTGTLANFALTGTTSNWVRSFPTITGITPSTGTIGTSVTVTGTNLMDATSFNFNGTAVSPFVTPTSDFTATVSVPANASTGQVSTAATNLARYNGPAFTLTPTNNALALDGVAANSNFVALPAGLNTASFTFESWVNYQDNGPWTRIFDFGTSANTWMTLIPRSNYPTNAGNIVFAIVANRAAGAEQNILSTTPMPTGWHHIAVTLATSGATTNGTLYLDGIVIGSNTGLTLNPTSLGALTNNWLGRSQYSTDPYLKASLDEVRIYSTALTQVNIQADMFSTASALPANLKAYYNFDQGIAGGTNTGQTTLADQSGNGNTGTLNNFALTGTTSNWVRSFPTITGISPTTGPAGTSVSVTGTNLTDANGFKFNGTAVAPFTVPASDFTATVAVPGGASTGPVSVSSATLTAYNGPVFTLCPLPTAIAQDKTVALAANGTGTLAATAVNNASTPTSCGTLTYGVQKVVYGIVRETETLTLTAPVGAVFTAVTFASYGTPTDNNSKYTIGGCHASNSQSVVESYVLNKTTNIVSIPANNSVFSPDPCPGTVKYLAVQAVYSFPVTQVSYTCADVAGPNYVLLTVTDAANNKSTATAQVTVTAPAAATITSISPTAGSVGQTITVTGTNLGAATGLTVNGTAATIGSNTGTSFTFVVPSGATATGNVVVSAPCTPASIAFSLVGDLTVSTTTTIPAGTYNNLTVTGTGNGTLAGNVVVNTGVTVQSGGTLNDGCFVLTGTGSFTLAAGGTLGICSPAGITPSGATGTVQLSGTRSFATDASYVYNGTAAQATGTGLPAQVRNLSIANPAAVALTQSTGVVQVVTLASSGNLTLGGQVLTLLSSATGTALVVNTGTGIVAGTTGTVQRYLDPSVNAGLGYRHYSAPVGGTTVADLATTGFTPVLTAAFNTSATPATTTPFPTVFAYDQARLASATNNLSAFDKGYAVPAGMGTALTVGQGYAVNLGANQLVDFVGTLTTGTQVVNLARNSGATAADAGWALVGNPYPAPIDFALLPASDRPNLDAAMYVFESTALYTGTYRAFVNGVGLGGSLIGSGQGFFVRVSTGQIAGTLVFRNAHRLTSFATQVPVRRGTDIRPLVQLDLRGTSGPADALFAYAETGATPAFDAAFDAGKRTNSTGLNLASLATTGEALAIDGRPAFTAATVLNLTVGVPAAGTYSLTAAALSNLPAGLDAFLTDNATGRTVNLSQQPVYAFSVSATQAAALISGRFALSFAARSVLANTTALTAAEVTLFPNPTHAAFTVLVPAVAGAGLVQATLFNALGQVVRQQSATLPAAGTRLTVETADLAAGVYTLRLLVGTTTLAKRVVIQ